MNLEKIVSDEGSNTTEQALIVEQQSSILEQEKSVEEYIFGTLLYTPQSYVRKEKFLEIEVLAPDQEQATIKILRKINYVVSLPSDPVNVKEIDFHDEITSIKDGESNHNERWQINFSVFVDKETNEYKSINEKPEKLSRLTETVDIFRNLSKEKGAILRAGDWYFESDGNQWVQKIDGSDTQQLEMNPVLPSLPNIE